MPPWRSFPTVFRYQGTDYSAGELREVIHAKDGCEILSVYEEDYVKGMPVLTRNSYGSGKAYYLPPGTRMDFLRAFLGDLLAELSLENPLGVKLPYGVTTAQRTAKDGGKFSGLRHEFPE